ncbi:hypothetical protein [Streptomyces vinaceus]|uniref:hypothetical protein n=1 Tax=Streptomyces vinaceus TaxID=1960 RepID=UPI0010E79AD9|nr:hypothetical protein [Streptomyces vinaceus]GHE75533.1 hypothetical protein GCM10017778_71540 [Streptomyces vinaceus]
MRGKFAGLVGIVALALTLGLGTAVEQDHTDGTKGHSVLAEDKGPGVAPTNPPVPPKGI